MLSYSDSTRRVSPLRVLTKGGVMHKRVGEPHARTAPGVFDLFPDFPLPDGQIEAVSLVEPQGFLLGVQWHPEWQWEKDGLSRAIFAAFAESLNYGKK